MPEKQSASDGPPSGERNSLPSASGKRQPNTDKKKTVLAVASAGGHWIQLRRLHPAFDGSRLIYATTRETYLDEVAADGAEFRVVPDCNRWEKFKLIKAAVKIFLLLLKEKPDVVISTGAAPGYFAIRIGKILGKKTIWVDSIANAEELSLSGQRAGQHVDHWLTQWNHLARTDGPSFFGCVLGSETPAGAKPNGSTALGENNEIPSELTPAEKVAGKKKTQKIFVTVGTDLPFDRLIRTLDDWAPTQSDFEIYAQIGETSLRPRNISFCNFIEPPEFKKRFQESDLIVSHAGMGTILSSLSYNKQLLVMPRIAAKREHRNEHQLATAKHLQRLDKINVAQDENELIEILESKAGLPPKAPIGPYADRELTDAIRGFIANR